MSENAREWVRCALIAVPTVVGIYALLWALELAR